MSLTATIPPPVGVRGRRMARALVRGRDEEAPWVRPALLALLIGTAGLYLWNLTASGYANSFYAAAVQAATKSWKAFFFGSLDSSSFITVDKPPASLWVMALSGRIFGFGSASMLLPQAFEGVGSVALLYGAVKRWFGAGAGLLAGLTLALTPVAALMFRFNNPDALLVFLLVAAAYCLIRAVEGASTRWVLAVAALVGFAFLTKMLQAFLVLPAFGLVYLLAAPATVRRRLAQLAAGAGAILVSAGWWVAIVALWPAGSRPMIDGSPDNSIINLILGYNGLGRIFGAPGPGGHSGHIGSGSGGGPNFSGPTGLLRLFNDLMGGQASWLLVPALIAIVIGVWARRGRPRGDRVRAAFLLWGGWLIVSGLVFSFASGVIHTYYTVALAPAIAALVAMGATTLWRARYASRARAALAITVALTSAWAWELLGRTPHWLPWLRVIVALAGAMAVILLLAGPVLTRGLRRGAVLAAMAVACLAGPAAYAAQTISTAHTGSVPSAGPAAKEAGAAFRGGPGALRGGPPVAFLGGPPGAGGPAARSGGAVAGGPLAGDSGSSAPLVKALENNGSRYRWVAAVSGSQSAATLELATGGDPVMAIGGFSGEGGSLSLAQFKRYVARGEIHYYIDGGQGPGSGASSTGAAVGGHRDGAPGGSSSDGAIADWVSTHFKSETIGGQTVYDLTQGSHSSLH